MNEYLLERIDLYLSGKMSQEEELLFQSELAVNEELSSAFNIYRVIEANMTVNKNDAAKEAALKSSLQNLNAQYFGNTASQAVNQQSTGSGVPEDFEAHQRTLEPVQSPITPNYDNVRKMAVWKKLAVAASLTGVIALGITWYFQNYEQGAQVLVKNTKTDTPYIQNKDSASLQQDILPEENHPSPDIARHDEAIPADTNRRTTADGGVYKITKAEQVTLYSAYFKPDVAPEDQAGPLEEAFSHYESGEYEQYITVAGQVEPNPVSRGNDRTAFYKDYFKAQSYLAIDNPSKAIPELQKSIVESPDVLWKSKTQWYLALAYLKTGQVKKSVDLLNQLAVNNKAGEYKTRSEALRKQVY